MPVTPRVTTFDHGISAIDTEYQRPGLAASHLLIEGERAAFVDTGANHAVPMLLAALARAGLTPAQVDYVFLTHVHLDHAGGAGRLMAALPAATAILHPRGARHMVDPAKLIAGSIQVYGEQRFRALYGDIIPIPEERVRTVADGDVLELSGRPLEVMHTEGHARHHYCLCDHAAHAVFTGDSFGLSYRELDTEQGAFILPTTTPVQFDPPAAHAAIERILAVRPEAAFLTHYSRVTGLERLARDLHADLDVYVETGGRLAAQPERHAALVEALTDHYRRRLAAHGCADVDHGLELLGMDIELNAQGLGIWLDRESAS
jgi:glyoxylase-like metal-dependent hydrolase (beta-lactamase superfamily II)